MNNIDILNLAGLRIDGRKSSETRKISFKLNISSTCEGSSYYEQGLNKVLVFVKGPLERKADTSSDKGSISCKFLNAPFSGLSRRRRQADRKSQEIETIVEQTFSSVVRLDLYMKSEISIVVHLLEGDGSSTCAIINAVTLALANAGIAMTDLVVSCSVGIVKSQICQDLNQLEISSGCAFMPIAMMYRSEEIIHMQLDNKLSVNDLKSCMESSSQACLHIGAMLEHGIKDYMLETIMSLEKANS